MTKSLLLVQQIYPPPPPQALYEMCIPYDESNWT